jgi:hypothetical protein
MKNHVEKEMQGLYMQWLESGQSKTLFAKEKDIVPTTFYYWTKKFQKQELMSSSPVGTGGFSPLAIRDSPRSLNGSVAVRINYPSGISVDLYHTPDEVFLRRLVE